MSLLRWHKDLPLKIKWLKSITGKKGPVHNKNEGGKKINLRVNLIRNVDAPEFYRGIFRKQKMEEGRREGEKEKN